MAPWLVATEEGEFRRWMGDPALSLVEVLPPGSKGTAVRLQWPEAEVDYPWSRTSVALPDGCVWATVQ